MNNICAKNSLDFYWVSGLNLVAVFSLLAGAVLGSNAGLAINKGGGQIEATVPYTGPLRPVHGCSRTKMLALSVGFLSLLRCISAYAYFGLPGVVRRDLQLLSLVPLIISFVGPVIVLTCGSAGLVLIPLEVADRLGLAVGDRIISRDLGS